jgi:hypothetical protein
MAAFDQSGVSRDKIKSARATTERTMDSLDDTDSEQDEDGMEDPLILRSLLLCSCIGIFFVLRYVLDVLLVSEVVRSIALKLPDSAHRVVVAGRSVSFLSLLILYFWHSVNFMGVLSELARMLFLICTLRSMIAPMMRDTMVVWGLQKGHVWVPFASLLTFLRVSSGRIEPHGRWRYGYRKLLCLVIPWMIRCYCLSRAWPSLAAMAAPRGHPQPTETVTEPDQPGIESYGQRPPFKAMCVSFTGFPVSCDELQRARDFNEEVMPKMKSFGARRIRRAMNEHGLPGHVWHVGHACPDPSKKSADDNEDFGWNLFAQHAGDNAHLGHCLVTCSEADYMRAGHVRCTRSSLCVQACEN